MRLIHASLLVGAAVLGLSAFAPLAAGKGAAVHQMTVELPGGGTETILYTGNVAPKVSFVQAPFAIDWMGPRPFSLAPSFAAFNSIAADMDRQMSALFRQAASMANGPLGGGLAYATLQNLGPGASAYKVMSESVGGNVCTRTTEITSSPNGGKPRVVSHTSGSCEPGPAIGIARAGSTVRSIADHASVPDTSMPRMAL